MTLNHESLTYLPGKTPFNHQANVLDFIVQHMQTYKGGAFLFDMGTGKSATALHTARLLSRLPEDPIDRIMIVCPKTLTSTWWNEDPVTPGQLQQHLPVVPPTIIWNASKYKTQKFQNKLKDIANYRRMAIAIINIEAFQSSNAHLNNFFVRFNTMHKTLCIFDESSYIKNPKAQRTKRLMKWRDAFAYRLILTGTDITKDVLDYYAPLQFAIPNIWTQYGMANYWAFRARYAIMKEIPLQQGRTVKIVSGYQRVDELIQRIDPYVARVRKEDCLDLPEKTYITVPVTMNPEQKRVYNMFIKEMMAEYEGVWLTETQAITVRLRAQQIAGGFFPETGEPIGENQKIKALLDDLHGTTEKAIIWANFKHEVNAIAEALKKEYGDYVVTYTGDQSTVERTAAIALFTGDARFFVATPQAGGFGLNLQFCTLQYWYSRTQRMDLNKQAEERSHRIGTKQPVIYKDFIMQGTVDEDIVQRDRDRRTLLDGLQTKDLKKITDVLGIKSIAQYEYA